MGLSAQPPDHTSRRTGHTPERNGLEHRRDIWDRGDATRKGEPPIRFDVIPRWALALGIGTISAAGVGTIAFEAMGSNPACVETRSAVIDSNSCAKGDAAESAVASVDELKGQLTSSVTSAQGQ